MDQRKIIPIFYAFDSNYAKYAMVSMKSLIVNANRDKFLCLPCTKMK